MPMSDSNSIFSNNTSDLLSVMTRHSQVVVLTDSNVEKCCLPLFETLFGKYPVIVIPAGEENKNLDTVAYIWSRLMECHLDRNALLVNLGGGVVSDMGGFAASCYNRGIDFVNVPTTLLAMIDASIGGKTGFDFNGVKNKIGLFADPKAVYLNTTFLDTLPQRELLSGLAEMVKYGFIAAPQLLDTNLDNYKSLISQAVAVKQAVVADDKRDYGIRRMLNFGHTIGHALEALCLEEGQTMLHGEAVAMGMYCSLYLSHKRHDMSVSLMESYIPTMKMLLAECGVTLSDGMIAAVPGKILHDKKVNCKYPVFVLLDERKECVFDENVDESDVVEALRNLQAVLS